VVVVVAVMVLQLLDCHYQHSADVQVVAVAHRVVAVLVVDIRPAAYSVLVP
jgi:hypothetical protein